MLFSGQTFRQTITQHYILWTTNLQIDKRFAVAIPKFSNQIIFFCATNLAILTTLALNGLLICCNLYVRFFSKNPNPLGQAVSSYQ